MTSAERHVETLRLRARTALDARRSALAIEDALRTATFRGERQDRLILVRQLRLGALAAGLSPQSLALALERAYDQVIPVRVDGDGSAAAAAQAVWFESALQAHITLALRLLQGPPPSEWFWPLAVPAWTPGTSRSAALRALALALAERPEAATAVPVWVGVLVEAGHAGPLLAALGPDARRHLVERVGGRPPTAGGGGREAIAAADGIDGDRFLAALGMGGASFALPRTKASQGAGGDGHHPSGVPANVLQAEEELSPKVEAFDPAPGSSAPESRRDQEPTAAAAPATSSPDHRSGEGADGAWESRGKVFTAELRPSPLTGAGPEPASPVVPAAPGLPIPPAAKAMDVAGRSSSAAEPPTMGPTPASALSDSSRFGNQRSWLPAAVPWESSTQAGGLLFLLNALQRLSFPTWLQRRRGGEGRQQAFTLALLAGVLEQLRVPPGDPIWAALGLDHQRRRSTLTPWKRRRQGAVSVWRRRLRRHLRQHGRLGLEAVVLRAGLLHSTATHLEVGFDLNQVDLRIRLAGLDLDPGWLPWLGRVVCFRYGQEAAP